MDCHRLTVVVHYIIPYGDTCVYKSYTLEVDLYVCMRMCVCEFSVMAKRVGKSWGGREEYKYLSYILLCWNKITVAARRYRTQLLILSICMYIYILLSLLLYIITVCIIIYIYIGTTHTHRSRRPNAALTRIL